MKKIISVILAAVMCITLVNIPVYAANNTINSEYDRKMKELISLYTADIKTVQAVSETEYETAFISVSDGKKQAVTVSASSKDINNSFDAVLKKAKSTGINPVWLKLDVVTKATPMYYSDFINNNQSSVSGKMHNGISFSKNFGRALLDSQINSSGFFDNTTGQLNLDEINNYFTRNKLKTLKQIPTTIYTFETQGYFFGKKHSYKLVNDELTYERRYVSLNKSNLISLASQSSAYLSKICDKNGKFIYGFSPVDDTPLEGYNALRHCGTVWNLIMQYDMTKDKKLIPVIERSLEYIDSCTVYMNDQTAFISERKALNIGGNGLALLAYTQYAEVFKSSKYNKKISALANGIIYMQKENGSFTHTLKKSDFTVDRDYIIVFYDGEAMFGLIRAYDIIRNEDYLNAAKKSAEYFIDNNYEELHSHWIEYAFNELTKFAPQKEYFAFGLKNVNNSYLKEVINKRSASHTTCETMCTAFELYDRLINSGIECEELDNFDESLLFKAIDVRVNYGINYFMLPEYAMYFKNPKNVLYSFSVREDNFRIRIDDIQHFMDGYYLYYKNYDIIQKYTK